MTEIKVSLLSNFYDTSPMTIRLSEVMDIIQEKSLVIKTGQVRQLRRFADDEQNPAVQRKAAKIQADRLKEGMPAFLANVLCQNGKRREHIVQFLPTLGFDIDHLSEARTLELMEQLRQDPHIILAEPSSSRHGLHAVLLHDAGEWLNQNWHDGDVQYFQHVLQQAVDYVQQTLGEVVDEKCFNPERTFGLCADDTAFYHPEAIPLHIDGESFVVGPRRTMVRLSAAQKAKSSRQKADPADEGEPMATQKAGRPGEKPSANKLEEVLCAVLSELAADGHQFTDGNHNDYIFRFASRCNAYGVEHSEVLDHALEHFMEGSMTPQEIERTVRSAYSDPTFHGVKRLPRKHGEKKPKEDKPRGVSAEQIEAYITAYGRFRRNDISLEYEVCPVGESEFRTVKDEDENEIYRRMLRDGMPTTVMQIRTIIQSHFTPHFHPFQAYRDSLPVCELLPDGTCCIEGREGEAVDYIGRFADRVHTTSGAEEFRYYFRIWMVAFCKSLVVDEFTNQYVLGLVGRQGIYKSTFFQRLLPPELRKQYFYLKTNSNRLDKDDKLKMANNALICLEEMDSMTHQELNQFKAVVTQTAVAERPAYGRNAVHLPRVASFCMTGNVCQLLTDTTGNRRLLMFEVEDIDSPYDFEDYEGLYAQAFALVESGFECYVAKEGIGRLNAHNQQFMATILEHDLIDKYLERPHAECTDAIWDSAGGITAYLENFTKQRLSPRRVAEYLRKLGYEWKKTNVTTKYRILRLKTDMVESKLKRGDDVDSPKTGEMPF